MVLTEKWNQNWSQFPLLLTDKDLPNDTASLSNKDTPKDRKGKSSKADKSKDSVKALNEANVAESNDVGDGSEVDMPSVPYEANGRSSVTPDGATSSEDEDNDSNQKGSQGRFAKRKERDRKPSIIMEEGNDIPKSLSFIHSLTLVG